MTRRLPNEVRGARDSLAALAAEFDEAASNWRRQAAESKKDGSVSSVCGEDDIPAHVLSSLRASTFEYVAKRVRSKIADEGWAP